MSRTEIGSIGWLDLTVEDADGVRDFYADLVGWESEPVDMGGYADHVMKSPGGGAAVAGVCHARGANASMPPQWLVYVTVADAEAAAARAEELGGEIVVPVREAGGGRYVVVRDPAGAVLALYSGPAPEGG